MRRYSASVATPESTRVRVTPLKNLVTPDPDFCLSGSTTTVELLSLPNELRTYLGGNPAINSHVTER